MMVGIFVAGLLMFAVIGVVQQVAGMNTVAPIQSNVAAGLQALQPTVTPVAADSLPAFTLQSQERQPGGEWLEVRITNAEQFVFADWWYACRYVAVGGAYYTVGNGYDVAGWPGDEQFQALPAITRRDIGEVCHGQ